jgi:ferrous iron transport protein B
VAKAEPVAIESPHIDIALAGNPNAGKTTVFNAITGARQHVGNYPGVTVEKKEGMRRVGDSAVHVVDLPGTYSLTAYSLEEVVARNYVIDEEPDVVIDVVDASNLERNLYLTTQFIELGVPVVVCLNMLDVAESMGRTIDVELLSELLGVPVVATVASKGTGVEELLRTAIEVAREGRGPAKQVRYGRELESHIAEMTELIDRAGGLPGAPSRWVAIKLLEDDDEVRGDVGREIAGGEELLGGSSGSASTSKWSSVMMPNSHSPTGATASSTGPARRPSPGAPRMPWTGRSGSTGSSPAGCWASRSSCC